MSESARADLYVVALSCVRTSGHTAHERIVRELKSTALITDSAPPAFGL